MKIDEGALRLSATDLANHLACRHVTTLDRGAAEGKWKPPDWFRPDAAVLRERGYAHERAYLEHLEAQGLEVARLDERADGHAALAQTLHAMYAGVEIIAQATLAAGRWFGRADVLHRVDRPGPLGKWSYEALDTKLARETRGGAILQLCLYSELLCEMQGLRPEFMHVVPRRPGFPLETYRVGDYQAYFRLVRRNLEAAVDGAEPGAFDRTYPDPVPHCEICRWWPRCEKRRRDDDHLSFVAGLSRLQARELRSHDVPTLAALATLPLPLGWKPARGAREGYRRVREQARVQAEGRLMRRTVHELLPPVPGKGFALLPAPSRGDVFLDLEADPYVDDGGIEFLFGWAAADPQAPEGPPGESPAYERRWALDRGAERRGFEAMMDAILARWAEDPDMHVYHFGAYEPGAIKRLMGRHATREAEVDRMLRAGRFVDLHTVVRQSLRASVEEYSIKKLEALYGFKREQALPEAGASLRVIQRCLELGQVPEPADDHTRIIEAYNRDDCLSAHALRDWLERLRAQAVADGAEIARPPAEPGDPSERIGERERRSRELAARLVAGMPEDPASRSPGQRAVWLLAHMLDWHRREEKAPWWEYFRLRELPDEELLDETAALAGLEFVERVSPGRAPVDRYRFPSQETKIRSGDVLQLPLPEGREFGEVAEIDLASRTVDVKKRIAYADRHPSAFFAHETVGTVVLSESLMRLGAWVAEHGVDAEGPYRAARDLLLGLGPRLDRHDGGPLQRPGESGVVAARRLALRLDHGALAIQGPPGSGKTYSGARMICDLVRAGRRVGVCAVSHKVIRNLLEEVVQAGSEAGRLIPCVQKVSGARRNETPGITEIEDNAGVRETLRTGPARIAGGTAWMWARPEFAESVDVLFVDEAGQMSLANVLSIAPCAKNIVLLGDPQQLEQPIQGSHPEGTAVSALEHVLAGRATVSADRGLFLEETWRLPPEICDFTSEMFYEERLEARAARGSQVLSNAAPLDGAGIWYIPVEHDADQSASAEEVEVVCRLVERLLLPDVLWHDRDGGRHRMGLEDILVIAPYNAQVADLIASLPPGARVGTVDRFQGQEAPVVIFSMTTSTPEDAPRGMEFLYNPNRLNVATSRARCACIVVGSPRLFEPDCQSPHQMKLANAFCRMLERSRRIELAPARLG
jgi:predicted RecB family nuclease